MTSVVPDLAALAIFAAIVVVVAILGIGLGMLLAPRLARWTAGDEDAEAAEPAARDDEEARGVDA